jgi:FolB domain-containing protein
MDTIEIRDLEVYYSVGVPDQERANPQRLLLTVQMATDFSRCAAADDLTQTIDYFAVCQRLFRFGDQRSWKLIEKLASEIADMILKEFRARSVTVEVKKFIIPQTRFVSVRLSRTRAV